MNPIDSSSLTIAIDGGTTNTRARLMKGREIVATSRRAVGVRDTVLSGSGLKPLAEAVREAIEQVVDQAGLGRPDRIVASGMLGAPDVGLFGLPHVQAPAGVAEIAKGSLLHQIPQVSSIPILFIPGVRTPGGPGPSGWIDTDVMRGEECETIGARAALGVEGQMAFVWPGSHTKLVMVDAEGRITSSTTTLAGEITMAVARHTLIAGSLPEVWSDELDPEAVNLAFRLVLEQKVSFMRSAFLVRIARLTQSLSEHQRMSFIIAAIAAEDAAALGSQLVGKEIQIHVGGRPALRSIYANVMAKVSGMSTHMIDDRTNEVASAWGALAIALVHEETKSGISR